MAKLVLIDDDPLFGNIMVRCARAHGADIDYFSSLMEMGSIGRLSEYDAAIVDYDLGNMTGIEIAEYMQVFFGDTPMVLVSSLDRRRDVPVTWPRNVRKFLLKQAGYDAIFLETMDCIREYRAPNHALGGATAVAG